MPSPFGHDLLVSSPASPCASFGSWPFLALEPWRATCTRGPARCTRRLLRRLSEPWHKLTGLARYRRPALRTKVENRILTLGGSARSTCPATTWVERSSCSNLIVTARAWASTTTIIGRRARWHRDRQVPHPARGRRPVHRRRRVHRLGAASSCEVGSPWPRWQTTRRAWRPQPVSPITVLWCSEWTRVVGPRLGRPPSMWWKTSPPMTTLTTRRTTRPTTPTVCRSWGPSTASGLARRSAHPRDVGKLWPMHSSRVSVVVRRPHRPLALWPCCPLRLRALRTHGWAQGLRLRGLEKANPAPASLRRLPPGVEVEVLACWTTAKGSSSRRSTRGRTLTVPRSSRLTGLAHPPCRMGALGRRWCSRRRLPSRLCHLGLATSWLLRMGRLPMTAAGTAAGAHTPLQVAPTGWRQDHCLLVRHLGGAPPQRRGLREDVARPLARPSPR